MDAQKINISLVSHSTERFAKNSVLLLYYECIMNLNNVKRNRMSNLEKCTSTEKPVDTVRSSLK